ncbi:hypothetical protein [Cryobacterium algoritolerans]|uniref:hypothetical protein n=1 Tax=Cryobacterium algoritolerans TaxID=1259184 RepID=UPI00141B28D7|nr:hypothetical protein [Cryobacterium algoritolerans]
MYNVDLIWSFLMIAIVIAFVLGFGLLLFWIFRVAVAGGMRDHYTWVEENHPTAPQT